MECLIIALGGEAEYRFWNRKIERKRLTYNEHSGGADVIILPYSENQIERMSRRRLFKLLRKISKEFGGRMVCCCNCERLKGAVNEFDVYTCSGAAVFIDLIDVIVRKVAKNIGIDLTAERIGVYDYAFGSRTAEVIMNLSGCCSDIALYTKNICAAKRSMEVIYDNTGMPVSVTDNYDDWAANKRLAVFMSDFLEDETPVDMLAIDVFGSILREDIRKITRIKFDVAEDFRDIFELTSNFCAQDMIEFILETGVALDLGTDIRIVGYE